MSKQFLLSQLAQITCALTLLPSLAWAQEGSDCAVPREFARQLQTAKLILVGEMHGTTESPAAFGAAVCHALKHRQAVSAGLELNADQVRPLADYLASDGQAEAVDRLLATGFWRRPFQDGRSSQAMLALVERLRVLKQRYPGLAVFVVDEFTAAAAGVPGSARDESMAARVRAELAQRPAALVLTLTGNVHSRLQPLPAAAAARPIAAPMAVSLSDLAPFSLLLAYNSGRAWMCMPTCGEQDLLTQAASGVMEAGAYRILRSGEAYSARWALGVGTASMPAFSGAARP